MLNVIVQRILVILKHFSNSINKINILLMYNIIDVLELLAEDWRKTVQDSQRRRRLIEKAIGS